MFVTSLRWPFCKIGKGVIYFPTMKHVFQIIMKRFFYLENPIFVAMDHVTGTVSLLRKYKMMDKYLMGHHFIFNDVS